MSNNTTIKQTHKNQHNRDAIRHNKNIFLFFTMNNAINLRVFYAEDVIISRIGNTGEEVYEPANVSVYTAKNRSMKGWIVARNGAGNVLAFNAIVPGNMPSRAFEEDRSVHFGKVPSLSYVDGLGKPIPTLWRFKFNDHDAFQHFFGLVQTFSELAKLANMHSPPSPTTKLPTKIEGRDNSLTDASVNLLDDISNDEGSNRKDDDEKKNDDSFFSGDGSDDFASPIFAQSQDISASLLHNRYARPVPFNLDCFSPFSDDSTDN